MSKRKSSPAAGGGFCLLDVAQLPETVYSPHTTTDKFYDYVKVQRTSREIDGVCIDEGTSLSHCEASPVN